MQKMKYLTLPGLGGRPNSANDKFSEDFCKVLHISVGPNIKILENRSNFLNFSADTPGHF
jgi:hypothetical protein